MRSRWAGSTQSLNGAPFLRAVALPLIARIEIPDFSIY
jgi:hypothetical protein